MRGDDEMARTRHERAQRIQAEFESADCVRAHAQGKRESTHAPARAEEASYSRALSASPFGTFKLIRFSGKTSGAVPAENRREGKLPPTASRVHAWQRACARYCLVESSSVHKLYACVRACERACVRVGLGMPV
eukprot:4321948-Pleurochrysis_carterae.AAC.1